MGACPHARLPSLHGQFLISQKSVAEHEAAFSPLRYARFRHQFVAVSGRDDIPGARFHHRNADHAPRLKQLLQGKPNRAKQRGGAVIEPAKVVRIKNYLRRITITELDSNSNAICKHS